MVQISVRRQWQKHCRMLQARGRARGFRQYPRRPTQGGIVPLFMEQFHKKWNSSTICRTASREILQKIGEKPTVRDCFRVGLRKGTTPHPVKFSLSSSDLVNQVLRKARLPRTKEGFQSVYVCPDRSVEERRAYKRLIEELKKKRQAEPYKFYIIRNNKIVSSAESSTPA